MSVPMPVKIKHLTSVLIVLLLTISAVTLVLPLVLPAGATLSLLQTTSGTCSGCTTISLAFPNPVQSGNALAVMVCWSGGVTGESFSDSSTTNVYQEVVSRGNTVECAGAWARASGTGPITETVSWTGTVNAILNIYEGFGSATTISVLRNSGIGTGTSLSLSTTSDGPGSLGIACYGTASSVTLTPGASFTLDGTSATGGCQHAPGGSGFTFPMTASASVTWAGIALVLLPQGAGITQCSGSAATTFSCTSGHATNQVGIGDMLVVGASRTNVGGTWSISDNQSNVWTSVGSVSNTAKAQVWYTVAKSYGYDQVTVNFADSGSQSVMVDIMDCGSECTNQSVTFSTGTGTGTSFGVGGQTMAIGTGFAMTATSSNPGTVTPGSGYFAWVPSVAGDVEGKEFSSQASDTCPSSAANSVTWAEICVSFRAGIVETLNLDPGTNTAAITPLNHFTMSYKLDGLSKSLSLGGEPRTWVDDQSDTNSISATTSGSTSTHRWAILLSGGVAVPQTWPSGNAAQTVSEEYIYYEQYRNTVKITPLSPSEWDASRTIRVDGIDLGVQSAVVIFNPTNGAGAQTSLVWTDKGQYIVWEPSTGGALGQSWIPNPTKSSAISSAGGTYNSNYTLVTNSATATVTSTTTSYATTTATTTLTTTSTPTVTQTQTTTSTSTHTATATSTTTTEVLSTATTYFTHSTSITTMFSMTFTVTHVLYQTSLNTATVTNTQTATSTTTQTKVATTTPTVTQTQTTFSTATATVTTNNTITATQNQTETATTTTTATATLTTPSTTTATVTSTTIATSVTTQTNTLEVFLSYLWIIGGSLFVIVLLALYILRLRGRPH